MRKVWISTPHSGGVEISPALQQTVRQRITEYAQEKYAGKFTRLDFRFRGPFCYIDAYQEPQVDRTHPTASFGETRKKYIERMRKTPTHLCRLRHFSIEQWSVAFYTYSHEKYEPCVYPDGSWFGSMEDAFEIGATYLI